MPLTLQVMGGFLKKAYGGDIRCRDKVRFEKADDRVQGGHAFRAMAAYENWMESEDDEARRELALLRLMGLFDRPADAGCLRALMMAPPIEGLTEPLLDMAEEDFNLSLDALQSARLLTVRRHEAGSLLCLDAHPLLREYFAGQLEEKQPDTFKAAHQRLFEHLCEATQEGDQPNIEDLQPLYQAVAHGCKAGRHQEACDKVYRDRIQRGQEAYSIKKLGAFSSELGVVACFFQIPWHQLSHNLTFSAQSWLLNGAAFRLRALGRLNEALEPMREGLDMDIQREDHYNAAISAGNLSELELTLGQVKQAMADAKQAMIHAVQDGDAKQTVIIYTIHADALYQGGNRIEALALFQKAEEIHSYVEFRYPLLYSVRGFRYCDLLLDEAERAASRYLQARDVKTLLAVCDDVEQRTNKSFEWRNPSDSLLDIALDHLTLGRAALYRAILEQADFQQPNSELDHIEQAVTGLRRAGQQDDLPRGLLTRAWLRALSGKETGPGSAQEDLDEAWEIAQRGPMPLFMADIHLYRARLFYQYTPYPWESPQADLAEARRLIEKHGYWRRKEELEDAEEAILKG